jgi:hypothetical protein
LISLKGYPSLVGEAVEEFSRGEEKASLAVRGRGKFMAPKSAGDRNPQSTPLTSAKRRWLPGVTFEEREDFPFGSAEFSSAPATEKPAPLLAA